MNYNIHGKINVRTIKLTQIKEICIMSSGIVRRGDFTRGHLGFPPTPAITASSNTFVNGRGVVRRGDRFLIHCKRGCHIPIAIIGSRVSFVNGRAVIRKGDRLSCTDTAWQCSSDSFA